MAMIKIFGNFCINTEKLDFIEFTRPEIAIEGKADGEFPCHNDLGLWKGGYETLGGDEKDVKIVFSLNENVYLVYLPEAKAKKLEEKLNIEEL